MFRENDYDFVYRRHMEEAVIDAVLKCMKNGGHMTYDEAIKIADTVPTQMKWSPCSERLPESSGVYIVSRWFSDGCESKILTSACYFDGTNTWHNDIGINHSRDYVNEKIVAWLPLPEPYKGEEE